MHKKKRTHQFQTVRNRNNFFSTHCRKHSAGVYLGHKSVNRLDNIWAYLTPALSWLLQVPDDAIIWPWDIVIVRESIFSVVLLLSPSPVLAAQDYCARTVYRFLQWIVFSWFLTFHSSHQACRHMLSHPLSQPTAVMYIGDGPVVHYFCEGKLLFCFWEREGGWSDSVSGWHHRFSSVRWLVRVWREFEGKEWQPSGLPGSSRCQTIHQVFALRRIFYAA